MLREEPHRSEYRRCCAGDFGAHFGVANRNAPMRLALRRVLVALRLVAARVLRSQLDGCRHAVIFVRSSE